MDLGIGRVLILFYGKYILGVKIFVFFLSFILELLRDRFWVRSFVCFLGWEFEGRFRVFKEFFL